MGFSVIVKVSYNIVDVVEVDVDEVDVVCTVDVVVVVCNVDVDVVVCTVEVVVVV